MANLTITIPDAIVPRIQAAFGHSDDLGGWVPASLQEVKDAIRGHVKGKVVSYEGNLAAAQSTSATNAEAW